ncbi:MAG TPA: alkaline phosphatase, partial [Spongiibacteraceae bacterium]|nr:alkaline phosphatase [Spongiibacteraceae bacterium]
MKLLRLRRVLMMCAVSISVGCGHGVINPSGSPVARNLILIIGDGMDDQQISIARSYLAGADGKLNIDHMPVRAAVRVQTISERKPHTPLYVADSANSATAIATGVVTSRGRVATQAGSGRRLTTLLERARKAGMGTGVVTTASVTDATPASFVSHVRHRSCEGPEQMSGVARLGTISPACEDERVVNGGPGSIAEQIAGGTADIILGGGAAIFSQRLDGDSRTVAELAEDGGIQVVFNEKDLKNVRRERPVLGLFAAKELPVKLVGESNKTAEKVRYHPNGGLQDSVPFRCVNNPEFEAAPSLATMTKTALDILSARAQQGFVLVVESASIDKQAHARRPCGHIGEVSQLNEAVALAVHSARQNGHTLVVVTADHGQAAQLLPSVSQISESAVSGYSPGYFAELTTREGGVMGVSYATSDSRFMEEHTGVQVPLYAYGRGARALPTFLTQVELYRELIAYLSL